MAPMGQGMRLLIPLDVEMAQAHQPMDQIFISLAQMVHFSWETPLIIPDFEIFKIFGFWAHCTIECH